MGSRSKCRKSGRSVSSHREYHGLRSMQPRFTTQRSERRSCTIGKAMTPVVCRILHVFSQGGEGSGVRFMKKNCPWMPFG